MKRTLALLTALALLLCCAAAYAEACRGGNGSGLDHAAYRAFCHCGRRAAADAGAVAFP